MIVKFYYKEPDAGTEAVSPVIQEEYPDVKPYSEEYWDKYGKIMKNLVENYGKLVSGDEDLHITIDTSDSEFIDVNGTTYRMVKENKMKVFGNKEQQITIQVKIIVDPEHPDLDDFLTYLSENLTNCLCEDDSCVLDDIYDEDVKVIK